MRRSIRHGIVALVLGLLSVPSVRAQVDDPLYPLDVGAVWEYELSSQYQLGGAPVFYRRERREVVGDTTLAGEPYRILRLLTAAGNAATWTPQARCAVRVDRSADVPVIEWVAVTGACAPREHGMALSGAESGPFSVAVVGDVVPFSARIQSGGLRLAAGLGLYYDYVNSSQPYLATVLTYVRTGDVEAGRMYEPGWWHGLVRLEEGDRYQYEKYLASMLSGVRTTYEDWVVRGDSIVNGTAMVLVQQNEYAQQDRALIRQSLCGVTKGAGGVTTVALAGAACTNIQTGEIWWFSHLRTVEAPGGTYPGSYTNPGPHNWYRRYTFAAPIGYVRYEDVDSRGSMGAHLTYRFALRYAVVDGVTYGSQPVAGEPEPTVSGPSLRAHPNPFRSALNLDVGSTGLTEVEVLDVLSRRVLTTAVAAPGTHRLDLSTLPPGVYVVRAALDDGTVLTQRVTKVR